MRIVEIIYFQQQTFEELIYQWMSRGLKLWIYPTFGGWIIEMPQNFSLFSGFTYRYDVLKIEELIWKAPQVKFVHTFNSYNWGFTHFLEVNLIKNIYTDKLFVTAYNKEL